MNLHELSKRYTKSRETSTWSGEQAALVRDMLKYIKELEQETANVDHASAG